MRIRNAVFFAVCFVSTMTTGVAADDLHAILVNRVDVARRATGMVAGVIDANGRELSAAGRVSDASPRTPDGNTVFEIGSITKVFTSLLLADMIERGEVKADTPVAELLPADVNVPSRNGRAITLLELSMQTSGLPRLPDNIDAADPNPYANYTPDKLYAFLNGYKLTRDPGEKYEYSNLGTGLLGFALSRKLGMSYEQALRKRILDPLGMTSTSITLSEDQKKRLAQGHGPDLEPAPNWDFNDTLAGCGALHSTANDLFRFLAANMGLTDSPLKAAMHRMLTVRAKTDLPNTDVAMGWHIRNTDGREIVWHNGGTAGYRSFIAFDPAAKKGVVILVNTFFDSDDLGFHLLDPSSPLKQFGPPKKEISLDPKILDAYVGEYRLSPQFSITVSRDGDKMFVQATNQPKFEIFAEKENEFFLKMPEAEITFVKDASGKVTGMVLHQNGRDLPINRVQ